MDEMNRNKNSDGLNQETFGTKSPFAADELPEKEIYTSDWTSTGGYAVPNGGVNPPQPPKKQSKALEICALVFGILSIVACCCYGVFGVVGIVLSVIALAQGKKSGMTIAGLICSIIGLFLSVLLIVYIFSEYSQEFQEEFRDAFEEAYEEAYGESYEDTFEDVYDDISTESSSTESSSTESDESVNNNSEKTDDEEIVTHEGTGTISNEDASNILIDGHTFTLPCKLSDILEVYEVSEYDKEIMDDPLEAYGKVHISCGENSADCNIGISAENNTEETMTNVGDAMVYSIYFDNLDENSVKDATVLNRISLGMSSAEVEKALSDMEYGVTEMDGSVSYVVFAGDNQQYSVSIFLENDKVYGLNVHYMSYLNY